MIDCPYDNYTLFEMYEREQERKKRFLDLDDCEDDEQKDWEDEIYEI